MISLEQIRNLEERVHTAVTRIRTLAAENATLKQRLQSQEERIAEFETLVAAFKRDQDEIEAGIMAALRHLDELEDTVSEPDFDTATVGQPETPPDDPQPHEPQAGSEGMQPGESDHPEPEAEAEESWQTSGDETPPETVDAYDPGAEIDDRYVPGPGEVQPGNPHAEDSNGSEEPELDIF